MEDEEEDYWLSSSQQLLVRRERRHDSRGPAREEGGFDLRSSWSSDRSLLSAAPRAAYGL